MAIAWLLTGSVHAQPPTQVHVPSFTPVSPQPAQGNEDDPPPRVGPVTEADCRPQQDAAVQSKVDYAVVANGAASTDPTLYRDSIRESYFKEGGMPQRMIGMGLTGSRIQAEVRFNAERAGQPVPRCTEINSCVRAMSLTDSRLKSCLWDVALGRAGASQDPPQVEPSPAPAVRVPAACSDEQRHAIEAGARTLDTRAERFLRSPQGQHGGSATPSLKLVMWITQQQAALIEPCKGDPAYAARVAELDKSHEAARQACITLAGDLGDWAPCGPVSPEDLLAERP